MNSIQKFTRGGGPVSVAPQHSALEANTAVASEVASPNAQFESLRKVAQKTSESLEKNRIQMESVAAELQRMADGSGRSLGFQFVQALDGPVITVSNTKTGEVFARFLKKSLSVWRIPSINSKVFCSTIASNCGEHAAMNCPYGLSPGS